MPATLFTATNLSALLRAASDSSDGTLADVCAIASEYGGCDVSPSVLSGWLRKGRRLAEAGMDDAPYAVFATEFDLRLPERDASRRRLTGALTASIRQALADVDSVCDCGRPKDRGMGACSLCLAMDGRSPTHRNRKR